jgi:uncharacterized membrane protein YhdT
MWCEALFKDITHACLKQPHLFVVICIELIKTSVTSSVMDFLLGYYR